MNRLELIAQLMELRKNFTHQDYVDCYRDEWNEIPNDLNECRDKMEEYITHTYDTDLIKELIENGGE